MKYDFLLVRGIFGKCSPVRTLGFIIGHLSKDLWQIQVDKVTLGAFVMKTEGLWWNTDSKLDLVLFFLLTFCIVNTSNLTNCANSQGRQDQDCLDWSLIFEISQYWIVKERTISKVDN